jgi:hypothetical protein
MNILSVKHSKDYIVEVVFKNGLAQKINLKNYIFSFDHPNVNPYRDIENFKRVRVEYGFLAWDDSFEILGEDLIKIARLNKNASPIKNSKKKLIYDNKKG